MEFQATVREWIVYFGQKYKDVKWFTVEKGDDIFKSLPPNAVQSFEEPLKKTISNMKQFQTYRVILHPLTKGIARTIGTLPAALD